MLFRLQESSSLELDLLSQRGVPHCERYQDVSTVSELCGAGWYEAGIRSTDPM